jgi:hypothetical protein
MEFKGTKGEWKICESFLENSKDNKNSVVIFSKDREHSSIKDYPYAMVCSISPLLSFNKEDEANAKLIAAAPELLKALQLVASELFHAIECINGLESAKLSTTIKKADEAINKALN